MTYLLDTNICIYALNRRPPEVLRRLRQLRPDDVTLSVVTVVELRAGADGSREPDLAHAKLDAFFAPLRVLSFDEDDANACASLRSKLRAEGRPIGHFDSLIAAQALRRDHILVSNNLREFARVEGLRRENWVEA